MTAHIHTMDEIHVTRDNAFVIARLVILIGICGHAGAMATVVEEEYVSGLRLGDELLEGLPDIGARRRPVIVIGVDEHRNVILRESEPVH